jgi:hypothetical protein
MDDTVKSSRHSPGCAYAEFIRRMPDCDSSRALHLELFIHHQK